MLLKPKPKDKLYILGRKGEAKRHRVECGHERIPFCEMVKEQQWYEDTRKCDGLRWMAMESNPGWNDWEKNIWECTTWLEEWTRLPKRKCGTGSVQVMLAVVWGVC